MIAGRRRRTGTRVFTTSPAAAAAAAAALSLMMLSGAAGTGCGSAKRPPRTSQELLAARGDADERVVADSKAMVEHVLRRTKALYDDYAAKKRPDPPVIDVLIISGGGDWGAFGAGFLKAWRQVPAGHPLAMPDFAAVTGVSTGALLAPFAFVGTPEALDRVDHLYRNPSPDWAKKRGLLYFLPSNISFAEVPGLERELKQNMTPDLVKQIADRGAEGRVLAVNTTNLDDGSPKVFDLSAEARRAVASGQEAADAERFRNIMLASAGIPGAFPFRVIDDAMYVDGGVTGNIIYGGRIAEEDSFAATWQRLYPDAPVPKTRYWVLFNNQFRPVPTVVAPNWPSVVTRALETSTRAATTTALRHLLATAEISRLKRNADIEVRIVSIPGDWKPPKEGTFVKESMNDLADVGKRMGADPGSWRTELP